ncbi:polysaccharide pyruvyl transferase family protein [Dendrosporobacter sp. 1207_IL3150]|uniref:polysaccharide pyruvyl transferase family protein n=1 Tax=Dendrosporobacter sp. 1207_IL3150 TaxID=3084054 RepID=UPI002FD8F91A
MSLKTLHALHIASFNGNVGDIGNHIGFRRTLEENLNRNFIYTDLEIREFYRSWNLRKFDENFVKMANDYDLIIIGGGNFFEVAWDYSSTGTTIDISKEILERLKTPIFFNGVGVDDGKGVTESTINKFGSFLTSLTSSPKYIVSVRNDGSQEILRKYYPKDIIEKIYKIPDGGFFVKPKGYIHPEIAEDKKIIGINIAGDMPTIRFNPEIDETQISMDEFIKDFAVTINKLLAMDPSIHLVFIPHIIKDYEIMTRVFSCINDVFLRTRVTVSPCLNGTVTDGSYIFDLYSKCDLTIGMRYHSNVCSIGQGIPTIGLLSYHKHIKLYEDIGLEDRVIEANKKGFAQKLLDKTVVSLASLESLKIENSQIMRKMTKETEEFHKKLDEWLKINGL